jgi:transcriptional regulator
MNEKTPYHDFSMSQYEIADALETTRENISTIEKSALKKLKVILEKRGYKASDFLENNAQ